MIEARVLRSLPIAASLDEAHLYGFDGERADARATALPTYPGKLRRQTTAPRKRNRPTKP